MRIKFTSVIGDLLTQEQILMKKIELAQIKKQIDMISTFLPDELLRLSEKDLGLTHHYVGVLMMTQIIGFTALTEKYNKIGKGGIYKLTATLNAYIGALIETFYFYGGDVLKFSGEIILSLWKVKPDSSLYEILHEVIVCALVLQQILGNFETEININLQLKLSITCGNMTFSVVGDSTAKNYFIIGDALTEAKTAITVGQNGEVIIGPGAWAHILHERYESTSSDEDGFVIVSKVFYKPNEVTKKKHYEEKQIEVIHLIDKHITLRENLHSSNKFESSLTMTKMVETFVRSLPQRLEMKQAAKFWKVEELRPFIIQPIQDQVDESQPVEYLTDMREVTVQCIKIIPNTFIEYSLVNTIQQSYKIINEEINRVMGVISKVALIDKDIMVLVLFGLKSVRHEMESQNALRSGYIIKQNLEFITGVENVAISVTSGFIYCGVIGHPFRREYVVIGSAYNRATKMASTFRNAISCDKKTFKFANLSSFYFLLLNTYKSKDSDDMGQVFEYNEEFEDVEPFQPAAKPIFGRTQEYNLIRAIIYKDERVKEFQGVCFHGPSNVGKTAILNVVLDAMRGTQSFNITSIKLAADSKIPYFCITRLYRQLYDNRTKLNNNDVPVILNVPRVLRDQIDTAQYAQEDVAIRKYRLLNYFRDLILSSSRTSVIFIDNLHNIDLQSWEILEIVASEEKFRLVSTANFENQSWELKFKLSLNDTIKLVDCLPLDTTHVASMACYFLNVAGIPKHLENLLIESCDGMPGYIQNCLMRLLNDSSLEFMFINVIEKNESTYVYPELAFVDKKSDIITIAKLTEAYEKTKHDILTIAAISLDLYDSWPPYHQLVVKTASVLGELFIRTLLVVALKYPAEQPLAKVIQTLFESEIFDCGSRYINTTNIETSQICCVCYFEDDYFELNRRSEIPKYGYCKIIHFKNRSMRDVVYNLLPDNQKKELHLMCTDVLEYMAHFCPKCVRMPTNGYVNFPKFKDILSYCNNLIEMQVTKKIEVAMTDEIKQCVRRGINGMSLESSGVYIGNYYGDKCNCLEIYSRTYKSLIYHSESAGHLGKRIFFTMKYGLTLICLDDYYGSIEILSEARELCMIDAKLATAQITEPFRKIHLGKINYALARAYADLHQLNTAKNYLAVALRQHNIPSVAITYKHFSKFISRYLLVRTKRMKPIRAGYTLGRIDLAACLSLCGKIFYLEGRWSLARMACAYSMFIMKYTNPTIPVLYEVYSNAMDVYKYCDQVHTCENLQKFVKKQLQLNYANNNTVDLYNLTALLSNFFFMRTMAGDICGAIRLGYRIIDISLQLYSQSSFTDVTTWQVMLLFFNFRLRDCLIVGTICRASQSRGTRLSFYYVVALILLIRTGFYIENPETIIDYAKERHTLKSKDTVTWMDHLMHAVIFTYYMNKGKYQLAREWKFTCQFNKVNTKKEIVLKTLMFALESRIYIWLRHRRLDTMPTDPDEVTIKAYLKLLKVQTIARYRIFHPLFLIYKAWYLRIKNKKRKAKKYLKKAKALCEIQENLMTLCWITTIEAGWRQHLSHSESTNELAFEHTVHMSMAEVSHTMKILPLE